MSNLHEFYPPSLNYGNGAFYRRIRLLNGAGWAVCELEDLYHAMRVRLHHADGIVSGVESELLRLPMNTCGGAGSALQCLVGTPLDTTLRGFYGGGRARFNCTHLFDMAWLALRHTSRPGTERRYDAIIPDAVDEKANIKLILDSNVRLEWALVGDEITAPARFKDVNLTKGFTRWAEETLSGDDLEAALILHKAYFVGSSRRLRIDETTRPPSEDFARHNVCFGLASERAAVAERLPTRLDTVPLETLLQLPPPRWG
jgi:hypothetical protein